MGNHWELLWELTLTDFRLKYKNSALGFFWSLLKPLLYSLVLYLVFSVFIRVTIPNYELYLLLGILFWNYIADCTSAGLHSIVAKANLIKKAAFPRSLIVLSACLDTTLTFAMTMAIFFLFLLLFGIVPYLLPIFLYLVFFLFVFLLGLSFILAALFVRYRDLSHLWDVALQIGFWLSPIVYSLEIVPAYYRAVYLLNPATQVIMAVRQSLIFQEIPGHPTLTGIA